MTEQDLEPRVLRALTEGPMPVALLRVRLRMDKSEMPALHRTINRLAMGGFVARQEYRGGLTGWKLTRASWGALAAVTDGQPWDLAILAGRAAAERS